MQLHHKDFGKRTQFVESMMQISYNQTETKVHELSNLTKLKTFVNKQEFMEPEGIKIRQHLVLKTIPYKQLTRRSPKDNERLIKFKEQSLMFKDDKVLHYY